MITKDLLNKIFDYKDGTLIRLSTNNIHKSTRKNRRHRININNKKYSISRLIYIYHNGCIPDGKYIDHIDRNPINNNMSNLRLSSPSQNNSNRSPKKPIYKTKHNTYTAKIQFMLKSHYIGSFKSKKEAIIAYNKKCSLIHGEFAVLIDL